MFFLQPRFKARVEDKKNKIKNWLRETLKSPSFIELAKKKLIQAGYYSTRRLYPVIKDVQDKNSSSLDERTMDEINLTNLIQDRIFGDDNTNESEKLLRTLALREIMLNENKPHILQAYPENLNEDEKKNKASFMDYVKMTVD